MAKTRALTLGLLASTVLASPAFAAPAHSPAPGTNATDVTAPLPIVQQALDVHVADQVPARGVSVQGRA